MSEDKVEEFEVDKETDDIIEAAVQVLSTKFSKIVVLVSDEDEDEVRYVWQGGEFSALGLAEKFKRFITED